MSVRKMRERTPSAQRVGEARLLNYRLVCNKRSRDGSGKANAVTSPGDVVWGVLYEMDREDLGRLDRFEGGYTRTSLIVVAERGELLRAETYLSTRLTEDARPYESYKNRILAGAREHSLPDGYILGLERIPTMPEAST